MQKNRKFLLTSSYRRETEVSFISSIIKKRWQEVIDIADLDKAQIETGGTICCPSCERKHSALHLACRHDPPVRVLKVFTKCYPKLLREPDCTNKYPLHIACENGASRDVIKMLIRGNKDALMSRDNDGKLPIHAACRHYLDRVDPLLTEEEATSSLLTVLNTLLIACPESILEEDEEDMCPIEHAIEAGLDYDVVHMLQKAAEDERLRRR